MSTEPQDKTKQKKASLPDLSEVNEHIGRKLQQMFNYIAEQPVPDRFHELLAKLDAAEVGERES